MGWDDNEALVKRDDDKICVVNMNEEELELVQGGADPFTPQELTEVKGVINSAAERQGVNLRSATIQVSVGTVAAFSANAVGDIAGGKVNKKNN